VNIQRRELGWAKGSDVRQEDGLKDGGRRGENLRMRVMPKFWVTGRMSHPPGHNALLA
jgi:hypothetical protein